MEALREALARYGPPGICSSDQGSRFAGRHGDNRHGWPRLLDRQPDSDANASPLNALDTGSEARRGIGAWISLCIVRHPHLSQGLPTPAEAHETANPNAAA